METKQQIRADYMRGIQEAIDKARQIQEASYSQAAWQRKLRAYAEGYVKALLNFPPFVRESLQTEYEMLGYFHMMQAFRFVTCSSPLDWYWFQYLQDSTDGNSDPELGTFPFFQVDSTEDEDELDTL